MDFDKDNDGMKKNEESAINEFNEFDGTDDSFETREESTEAQAPELPPQSDIAEEYESEAQAEQFQASENTEEQYEDASDFVTLEEKTALTMINVEQTSNSPNELNEKRKSKKPLIAVLAALVIAAAAFAAYSAYANNPSAMLAKAKKTTAADYEKVASNALFSQESKYIELTPATEAEFTLDIKSASSAQGLPLFLLNGSRLGGSFNIDENEKKLDVSLGLSLNNESILNPSLNLDNNLLSLGIPELTDSDYITVDLSTLNEDLAKSAMSYMNLPVYDYSEFVEKIFSVSEMSNELNSAQNETGLDSFKAVVNSVTSSISEADKNVNVTNGEAADIEGVTCNSYNVSYSQDFVKDVLIEQAALLADAYDSNLSRNLAILEKTFPGLYESYKDQLTNPFEEYYAEIEKLIIMEPVEAVYYIDKAKKIRRAEYTTAIDYNGEQIGITYSINRLGSANVYDTIGAELLLEAGENRLHLSLDSEGVHSDKSVFSDASTLKISASDGGMENTVTIDSALSYDAALNEIDMEIGFISDDMPGKIVFAVKGRSETDEAAKTSKTVIDEARIETPALSVIIGAEYSVGPSTSKPRSSADLSRMELLKMDDAGLMSLYTRLNDNYNALQQRVLSLLGF